jgi:hypothetical protein
MAIHWVRSYFICMSMSGKSVLYCAWQGTGPQHIKVCNRKSPIIWHLMSPNLMDHDFFLCASSGVKKKKEKLTIFSRVEHNLIITATLLLMHPVTVFLYMDREGQPNHLVNETVRFSAP